MVHQELAFCPSLSVAENLCLATAATRRFFWIAADARAARSMLREIEAELMWIFP